MAVMQEQTTMTDPRDAEIALLKARNEVLTSMVCRLLAERLNRQRSIADLAHDLAARMAANLVVLANAEPANGARPS
jgi:hypothetical protein